MTNTEIVEQTIAFVKETLKGAEGGHDWFHIERVFKNTLLIAKEEKVDILVVSLGALLHDIADAKFNNGDETVGPKLAQQFLSDLKVNKNIINHVIKIIENISFKNSLEKTEEEKFSSLELEVVQDADRLDALGAIGIARAFNYGGFKNRELYNPEIAPNLKMSKAEYKKSSAPTLNHFYEKLLLLKDKLNTKTGTKLAEERHQYMEDFLKQFYKEWDPLVANTGFTL
ncbi:HD domain-containing protein [Zobellia nedashkovskayae]|uniref:HD domain-containing protein n=1 Tax=Zobellia nedashkovskayae TaxID=2779510 RepID=UPI00188C31EE|nr:HD domain-containing protein [Zobellia nedashkovskayae]